MSESDDTARFGALRRFLRSEGCCTPCSIAFAIAAVEREAGRKWEPFHKCQVPERDCKGRAAIAWPRRPKRGE